MTQEMAQLSLERATLRAERQAYLDQINPKFAEHGYELTLTGYNPNMAYILKDGGKTAIHMRIDDRTYQIGMFGVYLPESYDRYDVQPFIDAAKYRRDVEEAGGLTKNPDALVKVASIPETVVLEIKEKYGLDLFSANRQDLKLILKIVEAFYPKLKTTNKRIGR